MTKHDMRLPNARKQNTDVGLLGLRSKSAIAAAALALVGSGVAHAEQLAIITQSPTVTSTGQIILVDSADIATATRTLSYTLDAGFALLGADYDKTNGVISGIAASGDTCNIFQITIPATGDVATVAKEDLPPNVPNTLCNPSTLPSVGDVEAYDSVQTAGAGVDRVLPGGTQVFHAFKPSSGAPGGFGAVNVTRSDAAVADLVAATVNTLTATSQSEVPLGVDGAANEIVQLQLVFDSVTGQLTSVLESAGQTLPVGVTINSPTSFDKNADGSTYYLATDGVLYSGSATFASAAPLGPLPANTLSVTVIPAAGGTTTGGSTGGTTTGSSTGGTTGGTTGGGTGGSTTGSTTGGTTGSTTGGTTGGTTGSTTGGTTGSTTGGNSGGSSDSLGGGGSFDLFAGFGLLIGAALRRRRLRRG